MAEIGRPVELRGGASAGRVSYQEFWPLYLDAHRHPGTRACHYAATVVGILGTAAAVWLAEPLLAAAGILLGYAIAIASHRVIEGNRPLIRINAFYGAISDLRMIWFALSGRLSGEYRRLGLAPID